jgi:hypothetical protein
MVSVQRFPEGPPQVASQTPIFLDCSSADTKNVLKVSATCDRYPVPSGAVSRVSNNNGFIVVELQILRRRRR